MQMCEHGLIPKLVEILKAPGFRALILKLLYHLSLEDKIVGKELIALAVNLSTNGRNAERFA